MRTRVVIQSRLNSSRLPGKAMLNIAGMPLIELVARRASRSGHEVIVATSDEDYDEHIHDHLVAVGIPVMRGPLDDVLGRFVQATADLDGTDRVVRLTGDNPVMDADVIDELIAAMDVSGHTYGRVDIEQVPEGLGCEVFTAASLRDAGEQATDAYDREHVTPWLRRELGELLFAPRNAPTDLIANRCTVDSLADYDRVRRIFADQADPINVGWSELIAVLDGMLTTAGPMVPRVPGGVLPFSRVLLDARPLGDDAGPVERHLPDGAGIRSILADAVTRGVTHVTAHRSAPASEVAVRAGTDPALRARIGVISTLTSIVGQTDPACAVEASLERTFAEFGKRRADVVLFPAIDQAHVAIAAPWQRLLKYVAEGVVGLPGVHLNHPEDAADAAELDGLGFVTVPTNPADRRWQAVAADLQHLHDRGVVVAARNVFGGGVLSSSAPLRKPDAEAQELRSSLQRAATELGRTAAELCLGYALAQPWVSTAIIGVDDRNQLREDLTTAAADPLSADEIARVEAAVPAASEDLLGRLS